ncbi:DNA-binding IclR family transcriptional regulator [Bradyrhizobium elkanii]
MTRESRGIQSIEVGGELLRALARSGEPMMLRDLAREAGMPPAKAHPYLVSFSRIGLIEQDETTGRYEIGALALELGLISLRRQSAVRIATPRIAALADSINHAVSLSVWGTHGATVVRLEEPSHPVHIAMRVGSVVALLETATGRAFAAFMPPNAIRTARSRAASIASASATIRSVRRRTRKRPRSLPRSAAAGWRERSAIPCPASTPSPRRCSITPATSRWSSPRWGRKVPSTPAGTVRSPPRCAIVRARSHGNWGTARRGRPKDREVSTLVRLPPRARVPLSCPTAQDPRRLSEAQLSV